MIFRPELARKVMDGSKTVTRRVCSENPRSPWAQERCGILPGRTYAVQMGRAKLAVGRIRILSVDRRSLGVLTHRQAQREGFPTFEHFEDAWIALHGRYDPGLLVWVVAFELVEERRT